MPATTSADKYDRAPIVSLFPEGVVAVGVNPVLVKGKLYPEEEVFVYNAVPKRKREFLAGRLCARTALAQFSIENFPILMAEDRTPVWPPGIVGSISHAEEYCGVVVARRTGIGGLGFDVERVGRLNEECWDLICSPQECSWVHSLSHKDQQKLVTLIFSAKECLYKCQYSISRKWIDFHDVTISANSDINEFEARYRVDFDTTFQKGARLKGRYFFHGDYVFTGMIRNASTN